MPPEPQKPKTPLLSAPKVSLHYDSGSGNDQFGLGSRLDAQSIQRRTDRRLPQYQDALDSDVFTMSGAEELVPAQVLVGGAWVDDVRVEGTWARIERWTRRDDGEALWKVWSKDNTEQTSGRAGTDQNPGAPVDTLWEPEATAAHQAAGRGRRRCTPPTWGRGTLPHRTRGHRSDVQPVVRRVDRCRRAPGARLADSDDASHVFAWYLAEIQDERGHIALYKYCDHDPVRPKPTLPTELSLEEEQEAVWAIKGQFLRQGVYAQDGFGLAAHPYTVTAQTYTVRRVQPPDDQGRGVFLVVPSETRTSHYERNPDDPRVGHSLVLEVDAHGFPTRTATIGYPRRLPEHDEQGTTAITVTESALIHQTARTDAWHVGVPARARTWELSGLLGDDTAPFTAQDLDGAFMAATEIPYEQDPDGATVQRRCLGHSRTRYWSDDLRGPMPLGALGLRALVYQSEAQVYTPHLLEAAGFSGVPRAMLVDEGGYTPDADGWWAPSGVQTLDAAAFYQPVALTDPWGQTTTISYDPHLLFIRTIRDPVGNTTISDIDYQALQPYRTTDANLDGSAVVLDALGRVTALCVFGHAGEGDHPADPTTRFAYYASRWMDEGKPCAVYTASRERHADPTSPWQEAWLYLDGHGHELMRKVPAAPGLAPARDADGKLQHDPDGALIWRRCDPRWVGTGRTVVDNKGNPVRQYEPFFAPDERYESDDEIVEWGVTPELSYDPLGRNVRTDLPNGTWRSVQLDPWKRAPECHGVTAAAGQTSALNPQPGRGLPMFARGCLNAALLLVCAVSVPARAGCPSSNSEIGTLVSDAESALDRLDHEQFIQSSNDVQAALACADVVVTPSLSARIHRDQLWMAWLADDHYKLQQTVRSVHLDGGFLAAPAGFSLDSPVLEEFRLADACHVAPLSVPQVRGEVLVDGMRDERLYSDCAAIVQVIDGNGAVKWSGYLWSADDLRYELPDELRWVPLLPGLPVALRVSARRPSLVAGGLALATSAGLTVASVVSLDSLATGTGDPSLAAERHNLLVLGAMSTAVVGLGLGIHGALEFRW